MIVAPPEVIRQWRTEAREALDALTVLSDPAFVADLAASPRAVGERVTYLAELVGKLGGTLHGSALSATPGTPETFRAGLAELAREVARAQTDTTPGFVCPIPEQNGAPFVCGCAPDVRCDPAAAFELGAGVRAGAGAPGVESAPDPLEADLDAVAADDRARRDATDDGCEGGAA